MNSRNVFRHIFLGRTAIEIFLICGLCFAFSVLDGWGQNAGTDQAKRRPSAPVSPLVLPSPDFADWTVTFQLAGDAGAKSADPNRMQSAHIIKTGNVVSQKWVTTGGSQSERWASAGTEYVKSSGSPTWYLTVAPMTNAPIVSPSGFQNVDWITADTYVGTIKYQGRECFVCVPLTAGPMDLSAGSTQDQLASLPTVAFIDAQSRFPLEIRIHGEIDSFQFGPPPTQTQALPDDLLAAVKRGQEARNRAEMSGPKPY